ncbi:MAG: hydroxylamine oxidoreductase [Deltaproteobacteria bacterium]|nr:MAG: hydroxylamine oxidoreductase [Deltaproteobacteria bacterium]
MHLRAKQALVAGLALAFAGSLVYVQAMEVARKRAETEGDGSHTPPPESSRACVECHTPTSPGIVDAWQRSRHAAVGVGCFECHRAAEDDVDGFDHYGHRIAVVVTPRDCGGCHPREAEEFARSHHAKGGRILASLDNRLAEVVEGAPVPFAPHDPAAAGVTAVDGKAVVVSGCRQCHGSVVGLEAQDGGIVTVDDLRPDENGRPTNAEAVARILRDPTGRPQLAASTWPNTGIGRINLDGSSGSCSACHSRHDFSRRRARKPENCGKCHLGPDHPQKEIYEESKHGVAYRDLLDRMGLDAPTWVLGKDYAEAPTCATCHMSGNVRNGGRTTHDPRERISWTNRPPISVRLDTDEAGRIVTELDPTKRSQKVADTWQAKRARMQEVCSVCHTKSYVDAFYAQYDAFVTLYNEKFARPGLRIMEALLSAGLRTKEEFDDPVEWTWFYLWHHEGRRARHGASMMAPDYAQWHGMYEVAERFYEELVPQARALADAAAERGETEAARSVHAVLDEILARPEHAWVKHPKAAPAPP